MSETYTFYYTRLHEFFRMKYNPSKSKITIQNLLKVIKGITPTAGVVSLEWKDFITYCDIIPIYQNRQLSTLIGTDIDDTPVKLIRKFNIVCLYKPDNKTPNTWNKILDLFQYSPTEPVLSGGEVTLSTNELVFRKFSDDIVRWYVGLKGNNGRPFSKPFAVCVPKMYDTPFAVEHGNYQANILKNLNKDMVGRHKAQYSRAKNRLLTHNNITILTPYIYQSAGSKYKEMKDE